MTEVQRLQLPRLLREIVDADRELNAMRRPAIVAFTPFANVRATRRRLAETARSIWGGRVDSGDAGPRRVMSR